MILSYYAVGFEDGGRGQKSRIVGGYYKLEKSRTDSASELPGVKL